MAIMKPSTAPAGAPRGEKLVFEGLKKSARTRNWRVYHSHHVANPRNLNRSREIDFLILIEEPDYCAVVCLEVKDGTYRVDGGTWRLMPSGAIVSEPPTDQARTSMFAMKDQFQRALGRDTQLRFECAVAFTNDFMAERHPTHLPLLIGPNDSSDGDRLAKRLADWARPNRPLNAFGMQFAQQELHQLVKELEAEMSDGTIFRTNLETLLPQLLVLTEDQLTNLENIPINDHCVIDGAAGTGKTVLAMELARQLCEDDGITVGFMCSNPILSNRFERWASTLSSDAGGKVLTGTPDTFRENAAFDDSQQAGGVFDYLIVDEAQNLCDRPSLELMDSLLKGGLEDGRWALFGDFKYQNIASPMLGQNGKDALREFGLFWANFVLRRNCRNTHEISDAVARLVDIQSLPSSDVYGPDVEIEYFSDPDEMHDILDRRLSDFRERDFYSRQIILLSSGGESDFDDARDYGGWKLLNIREADDAATKALRDREDVASVSGDSSPRTVRYSNIHDFQGLESDLAILVMPVTGDQVNLAGGVTLPYESHLNRVLYTGMSRAKAALVIVADEGYRETLEDRWESYDSSE